MRSRSLVSICAPLLVAGCSLASDDSDVSSLNAGQSIPSAPTVTSGPPVGTLPGDTESTASTVRVNPFVTTTTDPFATFAADVDTASYDIFRRALLLQTLPDPTTVRIEEYVNYFHYDYPAPTADDALPFSISLEASAQLTDVRTKLLRVGIAAAVHAKRATNLVFLVDTSGSMAAENKLPLVQKVLEEALSVLDATDSVSIVSYAGSTRVVLPPTQARERSTIGEAIEGLFSSGGTNGASGIELAYQQASRAFIEGGINHVVLCTDGDFNLGITSDDALVQLIEQKRQSGVTLTALGVGERNNDAMMERVSNAGNGTYSVLYNLDQAIAYTHQRLLDSMIHVAKDVKLQVEFNPERVYAYRLIGYEDRLLADAQFRDDRVDAGEVGSGHQVTALFELALRESDLPAGASLSQGEPIDAQSVMATSAEELAHVSVRFKEPDATEADPAREVSAGLSASELVEDVDLLSGDALWAIGVASLAERLRGDESARSLDLLDLETRLAAEVGSDAARKELVSLLPEVRNLLSR